MTSQVKPGKSSQNKSGNQPDPLQETLSERTWRMMKHQPLVPLGLAVTVFAMGKAFGKFRTRDSVRMNYWLRARVLGQAFTIVAMVYGTWTLSPPAVYPVESEKAKQSAEFRERLKGAEESHQAETAIAVAVKEIAKQEMSPAAVFVEQKTEKKDPSASNWFRNLFPPHSSGSQPPKVATPSGSENKEI